MFGWTDHFWLIPSHFRLVFLPQLFACYPVPHLVPQLVRVLAATCLMKYICPLSRVCVVMRKWRVSTSADDTCLKKQLNRLLIDMDLLLSSYEMFVVYTFPPFILFLLWLNSNPVTWAELSEIFSDLCLLLLGSLSTSLDKLLFHLPENPRIEMIDFRSGNVNKAS